MSNGTIEKLVSALSLPSYQLDLRISSALTAQVVKSQHFIEPLVALSIQDASPQKCFCVEPTCPYGSLKGLELKQSFFDSGERRERTEESESGFAREITFLTEEGEISVTYNFHGNPEELDIETADAAILTLMKKSVVDGIRVREEQISEFLQSRETIKMLYEQEVKRASDGVVDLVGKVHDASYNFNSLVELTDDPRMPRTISKIRNILTFGAAGREARNTLSNMAAGYLGWATLAGKLEQGAEMLEEDAEHLGEDGLASLADSFRDLSLTATRSKSRLWRVYQGEKEDLAILGFYPGVSDEAILQAEEILTTPEKKIVYES